MTTVLTEGAIYERLRARFSPPEWAIFQHVANGTGSNARRWADAVAMGIWPSRGMPIHGFEIKVSRGDWLRELKNPEKAEAVHRYCDYWWIVVADKNHVQPGELPQGWGLMHAYGKGLKVAVEPERTEAVELSRTFLAAILRRAYTDNPQAVAIEQARQEARAAALREAEERMVAERELARREQARLREVVDAFNRGIGDERALHSFASIEAAEQLGRLVAPAKAGVDVAGRARLQLSSMRKELERLVEVTNKALEPLGGAAENRW